jgi:hypothetical protein
MRYTVEVCDGSTRWYKEGTGILHREDGPAIEWSDGSKYWQKEGLLHREDGPAIEWANGDKTWYLKGKPYTEEKYNEEMNLTLPLPSDGENTFSNLDKIIKDYGIKYIFIESGDAAIRSKLKEIGDKTLTGLILKNKENYWCELSWGSGDDDDMFDFAVNAFGTSLGQAIQFCLNDFHSFFNEKHPCAVKIAEHFNIAKR